MEEVCVVVAGGMTTQPSPKVSVENDTVAPEVPGPPLAYIGSLGQIGTVVEQNPYASVVMLAKRVPLVK